MRGLSRGFGSRERVLEYGGLFWPLHFVVHPFAVDYVTKDPSFFNAFLLEGTGEWHCLNGSAVSRIFSLLGNLWRSTLSQAPLFSYQASQ